MSQFGYNTNKRVQENNHRGFTLVELIISATIFALIIGAAFTIFISISRVQRKTMVSQRLAGEARYLLETIARAIREGRVSYKDWGGNSITYPTPNNFIYVEDMQGYSNYFFQDGNNINKEVKNIITGVITPPAILNSTNLKVNSFRFYITPDTTSSNQKPIVLITLSAENIETDPSIKDTIYLQTAVESRYY